MLLGSGPHNSGSQESKPSKKGVLVSTSMARRLPVYTDKLIPRGLIGCSGKILGCRALVLLHDEQGHPRLAITARGDQHLTIGLPQVLLRYEQGNERESHARVIVDREGMAAPFLRDRKRTWSHGGDAPANGSIRRAGVLHGGWDVCASGTRPTWTGATGSGPRMLCPSLA